MDTVTRVAELLGLRGLVPAQQVILSNLVRSVAAPLSNTSVCLRPARGVAGEGVSHRHARVPVDHLLLAQQQRLILAFGKYPV